MRHSDSTRPVSGEIMMPDPVRHAQPLGAAACEAVDADFETVIAAAPTTPASVSRPSTEQVVAGLDMLRTGGQSARQKNSRAGPAFWLFGALITVGAFWISGGHSLVRELNVLASHQPQQVLQLVDVTSRVERQGDNAMLIVDGAALNGGDGLVLLPPISINVLTENGSTTRYFLGTNTQHLGPGARFPFSSRLVAPREGIKSVSVTFHTS
ncbi:hypothetical protein [Nitratireductor sp.]|uniref:hypothetical protein n=1 Tax=Nitratireductor sp. TaxID=1872084 RepID=UPI0025E3C5F7|nr:hypothetical protein [Nitratireductor sp.]